MTNFSNCTEQDLLDLFKEHQHLDHAANFYGFENFNDFRTSRHSAEHEKRIVRLAELLQKTKHEAQRYYLEKAYNEQAYYRQTMKGFTLLLLFFISVSAALVAYLLWVV